MVYKSFSLVLLYTVMAGKISLKKVTSLEDLVDDTVENTTQQYDDILTFGLCDGDYVMLEQSDGSIWNAIGDPDAQHLWPVQWPQSNVKKYKLPNNFKTDASKRSKDNTPDHIFVSGSDLSPDNSPWQDVQDKDLEKYIKQRKCNNRKLFAGCRPRHKNRYKYLYDRPRFLWYVFQIELVRSSYKLPSKVNGKFPDNTPIRYNDVIRLKSYFNINILKSLPDSKLYFDVNEDHYLDFTGKLGTGQNTYIHIGGGVPGNCVMHLDTGLALIGPLNNIKIHRIIAPTAQYLTCVMHLWNRRNIIEEKGGNQDFWWKKEYIEHWNSVIKNTEHPLNQRAAKECSRLTVRCNWKHLNEVVQNKTGEKIVLPVKSSFNFAAHKLHGGDICRSWVAYDRFYHQGVDRVVLERYIKDKKNWNKFFGMDDPDYRVRPEFICWPEYYWQTFYTSNKKFIQLLQDKLGHKIYGCIKQDWCQNRDCVLTPYVNQGGMGKTRIYNNPGMGVLSSENANKVRNWKTRCRSTVLCVNAILGDIKGQAKIDMQNDCNAGTSTNTTSQGGHRPNSNAGNANTGHTASGKPNAGSNNKKSTNSQNTIEPKIMGYKQSRVIQGLIVGLVSLLIFGLLGSCFFSALNVL